jgi:ribonuclease HI
VPFQKYSFMEDNFMQLMEYCIERFSSEDLDLMAVISRRIWLRRNHFIFDNIFTPPQTVFKESLDDICRYNKKEEAFVIYGGDSSSHLLLKGWQPPPAGIIKVNWDASLLVNECHIGVEIVARDEHGNFLGARAITKKIVTTRNVAEAMAALEAILFCKQTGFFNVLLEGDAKQVVNDVNHGSLNLLTTGHFIEGIISEMQGFRSATLVYVDREANNVAHCLAKEASNKVVDLVWFEDIPHCILHALLGDSSCP